MQFKTDKDLHDQNVVLLQSTVLHKMLDITTDIRILALNAYTVRMTGDVTDWSLQDSYVCVCVHVAITSYKGADSHAGEQGGRGPRRAPSRPA